MSEVLFFYDEVQPHTRLASKVAIIRVGWTVLPHLTYSPGLAPSNYNQFVPLTIRPVSTALSQWRDTEYSCAAVAEEEGQQLCQVHVQKWSIEMEMH